MRIYYKVVFCLHGSSTSNLILDLKLKQLGESCGSCFCPPTYNAGECAPGLECKYNPQILDAAGKCVASESRTSRQAGKIVVLNCSIWFSWFNISCYLVLDYGSLTISLCFISYWRGTLWREISLLEKKGSWTNEYEICYSKVLRCLFLRSS